MIYIATILVSSIPLLVIAMVFIYEHYYGYTRVAYIFPKELYVSILEEKLYATKYKYRRRHRMISFLFCKHRFGEFSYPHQTNPFYIGLYPQCKKCLRMQIYEPKDK